MLPIPDLSQMIAHEPKTNLDGYSKTQDLNSIPGEFPSGSQSALEENGRIVLSHRAFLQLCGWYQVHTRTIHCLLKFPFQRDSNTPMYFPQKCPTPSPINQLNEEELEIPHSALFFSDPLASVPWVLPDGAGGWIPSLAQKRRSQCSRSSQARILFPEPLALWSMISLHLPHNINSWSGGDEDQICPSGLSLWDLKALGTPTSVLLHPLPSPTCRWRAPGSVPTVH